MWRREGMTVLQGSYDCSPSSLLLLRVIFPKNFSIFASTMGACNSKACLPPWDLHPVAGGSLLLAAALLAGICYFRHLGYGFWNFIPPLLPSMAMDMLSKLRPSRRKVRVYMDGCFDMMHYGHANALRQAKALGDELVVGIVSDEEIIANKGPPVMSLDERMVMVAAVKWVDEVVPGVPYMITEELMKKLFEDYNIDYIVHGDDPCLLPDGSCAYKLAKMIGRYKQFKRTEGVSSTNIVGRMLLCIRDKPHNDSRNHASLQRQFSQGRSSRAERGEVCGGTRISHFLPTSQRIVQFSNGKDPGTDSRIVYIDGAFDLFHAGHVEILKCARALGDFLLVGIHSDQCISGHRGLHHPIMNIHERSLSVLACRYVDEVIIGAPWEVTKDMIKSFNISLVVLGTVSEDNELSEGKCDRYAAPKEMGILKIIACPRDITTTTIIKRILANHEAYKKRNEKKADIEKKLFEDKSLSTIA